MNKTEQNNFLFLKDNSFTDFCKAFSFKSIFIVLFLFISVASMGQSRKELEKQKKQLQKDINNSSELLNLGALKIIS